MTDGQDLDSLLASDDPKDRAGAALALMEREPTERVLRMLGALLRDADKSVRGAAARALARHGAHALPILGEGLRDPSWIVRYRSVEALGLMRGVPVEGMIAPLLSDPREHVRYMAAKSLLERPIPAAIPALRACLSDPNGYVRRMAAAVLERWGVTGPSSGCQSEEHRAQK